MLMKWELYYAEQQTNIRAVYTAKIDDQVISYGSLLKIQSIQNLRIPELNDV